MKTILDVDLLEADTYAQGTPLEAFAKLRREAPVYFHERRNGPGVWCITKHADIAAIGTDPIRFSSRRGTSLHPSAAIEAMTDSALTAMDPPRHTRMRAPIQKAFTPARIRSAEDIVRHYADQAINGVIKEGRCDLFDLAASLPISMISTLMGLPRERHADILRWTNLTFGEDEYAETPEEVMAAYGDIMRYGLEVAALRRKAPGNDLVSALISSNEEGEPLNDDEIAWNFFLLMGAGNDTTRTLILNSMNILLDHPAELAELRADPALIPNMIEEALRLQPSVRGMGRTAMADATLRDETIRAGDHVYLWYCSGNRDEEVFTDPDRFNPRRANARRHQAFGGGGPHFCVGAPLARLQTRILLEKMLERLSGLERDGPAVRARSTGFINSIKSLPVRFAAGRPLDPHPLPEIR